MPRPGFVLEVDEQTPPILTIGGTDVRLAPYGLGTTVIYPADADPSSDPITLLASALDAPLDSESLRERLANCQALTIVFGDGSLPNPPMKFDVRKDIIEHVLELAAQAGVDDVALVGATGLHRSLTEVEFVRLLGDRVVRSFAPDGLLRNHDVDDEAALGSLGSVEGHEVKVNQRLLDSDLIINIVVRCGAEPARQRQLVNGITDAATIDYVNGWAGRAAPQRWADVADLLTSKLPIFSIEAVLGEPLYDPPLRFLSRREWEWNLADQLSWLGVRQVLARAPKQAANRLFGGVRADYAVLT